MLSNGMGGFDLGQGLDTVVSLLGVEDVESLVHRLVVIKYHEPPKEDAPPPMAAQPEE